MVRKYGNGRHIYFQLKMSLNIKCPQKTYNVGGAEQINVP